VGCKRFTFQGAQLLVHLKAGRNGFFHNQKQTYFPVPSSAMLIPASFLAPNADGGTGQPSWAERWWLLQRQQLAGRTFGVNGLFLPLCSAQVMRGLQRSALAL